MARGTPVVAAGRGGPGGEPASGLGLHQETGAPTRLPDLTSVAVMGLPVVLVALLLGRALAVGGDRHRSEGEGQGQERQDDAHTETSLEIDGCRLAAGSG